LVIKAEFFCGAGSDIKVAACNERAAVVESDFEGFPVLKVGDLDEAWEREGFVGTGEMPWLHLFAEGSGATLEPEKTGFVIP
jgi:hypothetical protein